MKNPTFTGKELAEATRGSWRDGRLPAEAVAVYTDTRVAGEGRLFLALPGEKFDAHDYLAQAVAAGAGGALHPPRPGGETAGTVSGSGAGSR